MSRQNRAESVSMIPEDIKMVFEEEDIKKIWLYLDKTFKVNVKFWKTRFEDEFIHSSRQLTREEIFVRFGRKHFEKPLNYLLGRDEYSPTWINLVRFIVKDKIKEKEKERDSIRNYYRDILIKR